MYVYNLKDYNIIETNNIRLLSRKTPHGHILQVMVEASKRDLARFPPNTCKLIGEVETGNSNSEHKQMHFIKTV